MTYKKLIYALCDPRNDEVRYIGRSSSGMTRPKQHLSTNRLQKNTHKNNWIKSLLALNLKPTIKVLHEFSDNACDAELNSSEVYSIQWHRTLGAKLTNVTDGGDGITGHRHSETARAKISKAHKGQKRSLETKTNISLALKGQRKSAEHRANMSMSKKGKPGHTPTKETLLKQSLAHTGIRHTQETKDKIRAIGSRLTKGQAETIKFLVGRRARTQHSLAKHFQVSDTTISYIINGIRYKG